MILLDLFCGAGGAAIGYQQAGWEVVGVDSRPQPNYPGRFIQTDWEYAPFEWADAIHASPPCQGYSPHVSSTSSPWAGTKGKDEPRLIAQVREVLRNTHRPYVIENVMGAAAELQNPTRLCGLALGLPISRHRLFETDWTLFAPGHVPHANQARAYADQRGWDYRDMTVTGKGRNKGTKDRWAEVMGWPTDVPVTQHGLREAIPPVYTRWIGYQLMCQLL